MHSSSSSSKPNTKINGQSNNGKSAKEGGPMPLCQLKLRAAPSAPPLPSSVIGKLQQNQLGAAKRGGKGRPVSSTISCCSSSSPSNFSSSSSSASSPFSLSPLSGVSRASSPSRHRHNNKNKKNICCPSSLLAPPPNIQTSGEAKGERMPAMHKVSNGGREMLRRQRWRNRRNLFDQRHFKAPAEPPTGSISKQSASPSLVSLLSSDSFSYSSSSSSSSSSSTISSSSSSSGIGSRSSVGSPPPVSAKSPSSPSSPSPFPPSSPSSPAPSEETGTELMCGRAPEKEMAPPQSDDIEVPNFAEQKEQQKVRSSQQCKQPSSSSSSSSTPPVECTARDGLCAARQERSADHSYKEEKEQQHFEGDGMFCLDLSHPELRQFFMQQRLFFRQIYAQQLAALSARLGLTSPPGERHFPNNSNNNNNTRNNPHFQKRRGGIPFGPNNNNNLNSSTTTTMAAVLFGDDLHSGPPHQHLGFPPAPPPIGLLPAIPLPFQMPQQQQQQLQQTTLTTFGDRAKQFECCCPCCCCCSSSSSSSFPSFRSSPSNSFCGCCSSSATSASSSSSSPSSLHGMKHGPDNEWRRKEGKEEEKKLEEEEKNMEEEKREKEQKEEEEEEDEDEKANNNNVKRTSHHSNNKENKENSSPRLSPLQTPVPTLDSAIGENTSSNSTKTKTKEEKECGEQEATNTLDNQKEGEGGVADEQMFLRAATVNNAATAQMQPQLPPPPLQQQNQFYHSFKVPISPGGISRMDVLSERIYDFHQNTEQTQTQLNRKLMLRDQLYYAISPIFPLCGLYIVGSSLNGFGTSHSDLDLCLMITNRDIDQRNDALVVLSTVMRTLKTAVLVVDQQLIPAKVPILRIKCGGAYSDIVVDLNVNNSVAIRNTHLLCYYSAFDWRVRLIVMVVKEWAKRRGINNASRSSFTSYSLVLMVIHYLQCGANPPVLPSLQMLYPKRFSEKIDVRLLNVSQPLEPIPSQVWNFDQRLSLGELLLGFLHYYAYVFIFESDAISIRLGRKMNRAQAMQNRSPFNSLSQWHCICIEEPFTLSNAAHSVYDERIFQEIKKTFADSYHELDKHRDLDRFLGDFPSSSSPSPPSTPVPTTIQIANAACSNFVAAAIKTSAVVTAPDGCLIVGDDDDDDGRRKNIL